jgi:agmatinase
MLEEDSLFADADSTFEEADFIIFGCPFDATVSHRAGTRKAPSAIRKESYNFETYLYEYDIDLTSISIFDAGDLRFEANTKSALDEVARFVQDVGTKKKFPIMLGGEHSLTLGAASGLTAAYSESEEPPFGVVVMDAHLDFREEYENEYYSHACITRRLTDLLGVQSVIPIGIRSMSSEERLLSEAAGLKYYDTKMLEELGMQMLLEDVKELLTSKKIYLSIDMDVVDPASAPGVGNPEPYGLPPALVRECIEALSPNLIGLDIMEVSPPYDNGNTAALAARLVRSTIALTATKWE